MTDVQKYFVNGAGQFIGSFCGAPPPTGAIEVATPPDHGLDIWNGTAWVPHTPVPPEPQTIQMRDKVTGELVTFEVSNGDFNKMQGS